MENMHPLEIVATLGPASWNLAENLQSAGANALRLNASHMSMDELRSRASDVREQLPHTPLVIDLQGAKMRLGQFRELPIRAGEQVRFSLDGRGQTIPVPHREIFNSVARGETLSCDDCRLRFRVESIESGMITTISLSNGILQPRKGVNVLEHPVTLHDVSEKDLHCILATAHLDQMTFAFSFMIDGSEAQWVRNRAPRCKVAGKIERREALEKSHEIARSVDAIWICRGDLGAQIGAAELARWVCAYKPHIEPCPVFMAGQVLEHLTSHAEPTRSEVCHLYELVSRSYAGFVLSDETAVGADPVGAVATLCSLLTSFE